MHGAEGVCTPLFALTKCTGSLVRQIVCLRSLGGFLFCDCRTNRVRLSAKYLKKKKQKSLSSLFISSSSYLLVPSSTNSRFLLLALKPIFPPSSSNLAHKFLSCLGTSDFLNKHNLNCFCFLWASPKSLIVNASFNSYLGCWFSLIDKFSLSSADNNFIFPLLFLKRQFIKSWQLSQNIDVFSMLLSIGSWLKTCRYFPQFKHLSVYVYVSGFRIF